MILKNLILSLSLCCALYTGTAQTNDRSLYPDRITLTWSDHPSTTQSVSWRINGSSIKAVGQVVEEQSSPDLEKSAQTVIGVTNPLKIEGQADDHYGQVSLKV
ncbi:fibronectin type III domain-containing protein [Sphingobacterium sp. KU25419]|nr:fibronectin type III domain-containing protein [Sphingobacterium sp. KU25419]